MQLMWSFLDGRNWCKLSGMNRLFNQTFHALPVQVWITECKRSFAERYARQKKEVEERIDDDRQCARALIKDDWIIVFIFIRCKKCLTPFRSQTNTRPGRLPDNPHFEEVDCGTGKNRIECSACRDDASRRQAVEASWTKPLPILRARVIDYLRLGA